MGNYQNKTASALLKTGYGRLKGIIVATASSTPTIALHDGVNGTPAAAVKATQTLTLTDVFTDGELVVIGNDANRRQYKMVDALSSPAIPYQVLIGASAAASLDNLKSAINGSAGAGTTYSNGTEAHPQVTATTNSDTTQVVEAITGGVDGNLIQVSETCANASWGATKLAGGVQAVTLIVPAFAVTAGQYINFGDGIVFDNGLYYTEGGTVDCTFIIE